MPPKPKKSETESDAARHIRELRESRGETQTAFAQVLGVKPSAVSKWEASKNLPQPWVFIQLAKLAAGDKKQVFEEYAGTLVGTDEILDNIARWRRGASHQEISRGTEEKASAGIPWDRDLLIFVIKTADERLENMGRTLPREKYAELIALLYEYCRDDEQRNSESVERFLHLVA